MAGGRPVIDERVGLFALRSAAPAPKTGTVRKKRLGTSGILIRPEPSFLVLATRNSPHFAKVAPSGPGLALTYVRVGQLEERTADLQVEPVAFGAGYVASGKVVTT
jgi:hypothetical protein